MAEATNGMSTTLAVKGIKNASWQPGTNNLWQTEKKNDREVWTVTHYTSRGKTVFTVEQGNYGVKVNSIPTIKWLNKNHVYFLSGKDVVLGTLDQEKFT